MIALLSSIRKQEWPILVEGQPKAKEKERDISVDIKTVLSQNIRGNSSSCSCTPKVYEYTPYPWHRRFLIHTNKQNQTDAPRFHKILPAFGNRTPPIYLRISTQGVISHMQNQREDQTLPLPQATHSSSHLYLLRSTPQRSAGQQSIPLHLPALLHVHRGTSWWHHSSSPQGLGEALGLDFGQELSEPVQVRKQGMSRPRLTGAPLHSQSGTPRTGEVTNWPGLWGWGHSSYLLRSCHLNISLKRRKIAVEVHIEPAECSILSSCTWQPSATPLIHSFPAVCSLCHALCKTPKPQFHFHHSTVWECTGSPAP